ncbi:MAG: translation elongation factor 4 [Leptospiraceae bacterium]|nr:translation elongation factor 4 [Leptospiraceae bacterium]MDW8305724.1 translation elongation factor 4 [Leptospiraceae bacterium]
MAYGNIPASRIRNFSIIAHIDHGKSTLADRLLELGGLMDPREQKEQILDNMDIERERGITIKSNSASFLWRGQDGLSYLFNLIDTPGHVDFTYEVLRSLAACEGVLLLIDATQGIQAQTIANFYLALEADLAILPVINKIDLASADIEKTKKQIRDLLGLNPEEAICVSAKTGLNVEQLMHKIIEKIPAPQADVHKPLRALVFDAYFDSYRGVVAKVRIFDGRLRKGDKIKFMRRLSEHEVMELGIAQLKLKPLEQLEAGEVGYIVTGLKNVSDVLLGDTLTLTTQPAQEPLFKIKEIKPMVFSGLFPVNGEDFDLLKEAMQKLCLNDPSLVYESENSEALGFGFRVGYLGLLHMEIVQERLEREFGLNLITTAPSVRYRVTKTNGQVVEIDNPSEFPPDAISVEEPYVKVTIISPAEYLGNLLQLLQEKRGENQNIHYLDPQTVQITYLLPLSEMIFEFYDKLKSLSRGYATLDYEFFDYRKSDLVKVDILVHGQKVDALAMIVHRSVAEKRGREVIQKLKNLISRHQFQIALQAAIGSRVIARENISALRKNVTAKCYGGDITRKRKLLEKQKEGKKRMKMIGQVEIPQEAFLAVLKTSDWQKKERQ